MSLFFPKAVQCTVLLHLFSAIDHEKEKRVKEQYFALFAFAVPAGDCLLWYTSN